MSGILISLVNRRRERKRNTAQLNLKLILRNVQNESPWRMASHTAGTITNEITPVITKNQLSSLLGFTGENGSCGRSVV